MLPYHQQALANDLAFEHKQDRARRGPNVIAQRLSQRLTVDYKLLTSQQIELYYEFWARKPSDLNLLPIATINKGSLFVDLDSMDTTEIFMNTTAEYRNATDHFMDYTELFTQKALFPLASQNIFSVPPFNSQRTPPTKSHTVSCRPLS